MASPSAFAASAFFRTSASCSKYASTCDTSPLEPNSLTSSTTACSCSSNRSRRARKSSSIFSSWSKIRVVASSSVGAIFCGHTRVRVTSKTSSSFNECSNSYKKSKRSLQALICTFCSSVVSFPAVSKNDFNAFISSESLGRSCALELVASYLTQISCMCSTVSSRIRLNNKLATCRALAAIPSFAGKQSKKNSPAHVELSKVELTSSAAVLNLLISSAYCSKVGSVFLNSLTWRCASSCSSHPYTSHCSNIWRGTAICLSMSS